MIVPKLSVSKIGVESGIEEKATEVPYILSSAKPQQSFSRSPAKPIQIPGKTAARAPLQIPHLVLAVADNQFRDPVKLPHPGRKAQ